MLPGWLRHAGCATTRQHSGSSGNRLGNCYIVASTLANAARADAARADRDVYSNCRARRDNAARHADRRAGSDDCAAYANRCTTDSSAGTYRAC